MSILTVTHNYELYQHNLDFITRNCEFISHKSEKKIEEKVRIVSLQLQASIININSIINK